MGDAKQQCEEEVVRYDGLARYAHQCARRATVERNGRHFCKQHDPEEQKRRGEARQARWEAERKEQRKQRALEAAAPVLLRELQALIGKLEAGQVPDAVDLKNARAAIGKAEP